jgi:hypothetical protein
MVFRQSNQWHQWNFPARADGALKIVINPCCPKRQLCFCWSSVRPFTLCLKPNNALSVVHYPTKALHVFADIDKWKIIQSFFLNPWVVFGRRLFRFRGFLLARICQPRVSAKVLRGFDDMRLTRLNSHLHKTPGLSPVSNSGVSFYHNLF